MFKKIKWTNIRIGGKYMAIFSFMAITFLIAIIITDMSVKNSIRNMKDTMAKNDVSIYAGNLITLYHEKYSLIPEYMLISDDAKLNEYLDYSEEFVENAKKIKKHLNKEQLQLFNKMIENNHKLDEYFFSIIVPKVQQINTEEFKKLQQSANEMKIETSQLGYQLKNGSTEMSKEALNAAKKKLEVLNLILLISSIGSIVISAILLYLVSRKISGNLKVIVDKSKEIASGRLNTTELVYRGTDEIGQLSQSINEMGQSLREMIAEISNLSNDVDKQSATLFESSEEVKLGSEQVSITIEEMAEGASSQADNAAAISQNMKDFNEEIINASNQGEKLVQFSDQVLAVSINGDKQMKESLHQMKLINDVVHGSVDQVKNLESKTQSITEIVHVIKSIAEQTNLLALNASIEAARAGEAGKGFAVVATEVRKLAEEVSYSIEGITKLVFSIKEGTSRIAENLHNGYEQANKGSEEIEKTGQHFAEIKQKVAEMSTGVKHISTVFHKFQQSSQNINENIEHIAAISEESAAGSEEISAAMIEQNQSIENISASAKRLTSMVERMNNLIKKFQL
ncbi:methyl-accepting chemotaxis protein [Niallia sp. NCCP-28]|uniref:methyl-accepting chemotaxis protein n=1 Tax=Niallia sp. NCCP-28 TaxID=2934712 RepID=UPI00208BEBF6|nr:HAMP domain-containing methyl-accepting chemotaxis protein [Niallia sp. NCCP-28]GKU81977.1 hypothetical protein NCCP28_13730 [Niallia sp. NCCP-28]